MLNEIIAAKEAALIEYLKKYKRPAVAFSGGVDSSVLLAACCVAGVEVKPIMAKSCLVPQFEEEDALRVAKETNTRITFVSFDPLKNEAFCANDSKRCYYCKGQLMQVLRKTVEKLNCDVIFDGANADDVGDYRPGMQAAKEAGVISPLLACGITKAEVRALAEKYGLSVAQKPAYACLASRIAYGEIVTEAKLHRVEVAEAELRKLGLEDLRVRCHGNLARIEVSTEQISMVAEMYRDEVVQLLKSAGFTFVSLDLQGYRKGSLNSELPK